MVFDVNILGCGSATPTLRRGMTSQYINVLERHILIDCGEGTQLQFQRFQIKASRIQYILISHLHGDHFLGLVGFLSSQSLFGRKKKVTIFCPVGLKEHILASVRLSKSYLNFDIEFIELSSDKSELIFEDNVLEIHTIPLKHRVYCNGFLIKEKPKDRKLTPELIKKYEIPVAMMNRLKSGEDWVKSDSEIIPNDVLTENPPNPRSYAFCSDTIYNEAIIDVIKDCNLLYHEATFISKEKERAKVTMHSTAEEAAKIAKQANAKSLVLGHFSARYKSTEIHLNEAKAVFKKTFCAFDGMKISVEFDAL